MELILWRHADAHDARAGQSDADRALTDKGERQAECMAGWLNARLPADARVLASPAVRTQQTARALGRDVQTVRDLFTDTSPRAALRALGWPDAGGTVVVVGHQPTLGQIAALLLSGEARYWSVKKAATWWLVGPDGAEGGVELKAMQIPDLL